MTGSDITELFSNTLQTGSGYLMNAKSGVRSEFHRILPEFSAILKENKEISKVHEKNIQKQPKNIGEIV